MARLRIPLGEGLGLGLGGGLSGGKYEWIEGGVFSHFDRQSRIAGRGSRRIGQNADLSIEGRLESGFTIRGYIGRAALLNPSDGKCGGGSGDLNTVTHTKWMVWRLAMRGSRWATRSRAERCAHAPDYRQPHIATGLRVQVPAQKQPMGD